MSALKQPLLIIIAGMLLLPSCERCIECSATRGGNVIIPPEDYCGNRKEIRAREAAFDETCKLEKAIHSTTVCQCLGKK